MAALPPDTLPEGTRWRFHAMNSLTNPEAWWEGEVLAGGRVRVTANTTLTAGWGWKVGYSEVLTNTHVWHRTLLPPTPQVHWAYGEVEGG